MHILKTIWTNWQSISKKIFEGKLGEKIKRGDLYFILLDIFLFIQVFSESQLNEQLFVEDLLFVSRIIVLILLTANAIFSLRLHASIDVSIKMGFVYVFFGCCLANAILFYGGQSLLYIVFAVVGAKDKPLKRVFKNTLISLTVAHAIVLFLCMIGLLLPRFPLPTTFLSVFLRLQVLLLPLCYTSASISSTSCLFSCYLHLCFFLRWLF